MGGIWLPTLHSTWWRWLTHGLMYMWFPIFPELETSWVYCYLETKDRSIHAYLQLGLIYATSTEFLFPARPKVHVSLLHLYQLFSATSTAYVYDDVYTCVHDVFHRLGRRLPFSRWWTEPYLHIYIYGQYFPAYAYVLGTCNNCVHHLQLDLRCELSDIPLFSAGGLGRPCEKFLACISLCFSVCCA